MSLYSTYFYSKEVNDLLSNEEFINQMLRFEGALALAQAENGIIPKLSASIINEWCSADYIDIEKLKSDIKLSGNAAIPLIKQLTQVVEKINPEASKYIHLGATSQDVIDTATTLQMFYFTSWLDKKLIVIINQLNALSQEHQDTKMAGRTLLQHAKSINFGDKINKWTRSIRLIRERIEESGKRVFTMTLGGAVGFGNEFINDKVKESLIDILSLNSPIGVWGGVEFASILGSLSGYLGKIAKDISLLMQTEVAEVFEGAAEGKGGSSTMPHKRNPVTCAAIIANTTRMPHLVASTFSSMPQEYERSVGLWHSEWEVLNEIMLLIGGSVDRTIELLKDLEVDKKRMSENLKITNGLIDAEDISLALAKKIGKTQAHELVQKACKIAISEQKHLKEVLTEMGVILSDEL
jgi:3-carboxy-cis,cis-muconate cycloisomerase